MCYAVECKDLIKTYKKSDALSRVNLSIEKNKIYGLLGRNGSGKTTLLNIISGNILKTHGDIKVFGKNPYENQKILSKICFIKDNIAQLFEYKAKKVFEMASGFFDNWDEEYKDKLADKFELDLNKKVIFLSKGMQSVVGIIIGLASRAELTIFDEAYLGLDAVARKIFYDELIADFSEYKRTIILSTHLISELSNVFEKVIILDKGFVRVNDDFDNIMQKSFCIVGDKDKIKDITKEKNVLNTEEYKSLGKVFIYDELSQDDINKLKNYGCEIKSIALQDLFINMCSNNGK